MYKCLECGHIFDEGEEARWIEPHGELVTGCPMTGCHSAYERTVHCKDCGAEHLEDELYAGRCKECLRDSITYSGFLEYLIDKQNGLSHFMFHCFFEESDVPNYVSSKLNKTLREWFLRQQADDQICGRTDFLNLCRKYVIEDDGESGRYDYAEWLNERQT